MLEFRLHSEGGNKYTGWGIAFRHKSDVPKALDNKKGGWLISDAGLKSGKLMKEARKAGVKVITRLNSNFVVVRFGAKFRKEEILSNIKPIQRVIDGESYIIYPFKKCIWQGRTAGNLFLVRGAGYDDFIALFTTSLNTKPETVIRNEINKQQSQIDIEFPDGNTRIPHMLIYIISKFEFMGYNAGMSDFK